MPIITLTTDLGYRDPYLAIVKVCILKSIPDVQIIDLSCDIKDNNISDAAFILKNSLKYFPAHSIHLVGVKFINSASMLGKNKGVDNTRYLLTKYNDQYIITPDNGFITLLDEAYSGKVYQLYFNEATQHNFFLKDIFVEVAAHIAEGKPVEEIGIETTDYYKAFQFSSFTSPENLKGKSIYIDDFGNVITNISKEQFYKALGNRKFSIVLPGARITKISDTYDDVRIGDALAIFNSFGYLEIALNGKSAYKMLYPRDVGRSFDFNLIVEFND
ncbi:MAG: SAM hydrolase/SAM-dependent halogenase family protein [Bacteroidia bacterium]